MTEDTIRNEMLKGVLLDLFGGEIDTTRALRYLAFLCDIDQNDVTEYFNRLSEPTTKRADKK